MRAPHLSFKGLICPAVKLLAQVAEGIIRKGAWGSLACIHELGLPWHRAKDPERIEPRTRNASSMGMWSASQRLAIVQEGIVHLPWSEGFTRISALPSSRTRILLKTSYQTEVWSPRRRAEFVMSHRLMVDS